MKAKSKINAYILCGSAAALLFLCVIAALSSAISLPTHAPKFPAPQTYAALAVNAHESAASALQWNRTLTFADRVAYQRAIEDVYWRHRIWPKENRTPKPSLDAVMSQAQLREKVADYLRESEELQNYWQRPITAEDLQVEMDRMASNTKQPEVLRELFAALGNDPFVIAECLARPVLIGRLITDSSSQRRGGHFESVRAQELRIKSVTTMLERLAYTLPTISEGGSLCADDSWTATSETNDPRFRAYHTAVWTGSEMIVWGGFDGVSQLNTGGRYKPSSDSWTSTSTTNAPEARVGHRAVWTGTKMILWGGGNPSGFLNTGGIYNPGTDSWTATSTTNAPTGRSLHTAVWTGTEMIIWGGFNDSSASHWDKGIESSERVSGIGFNSGGKYNPDTDSWTATSTTNAPTARYYHTATWTGSEMIVWGGGTEPENVTDTGGRYNPIMDNWTATSTTHAPDPRWAHTAVWTDSEIIVWGGVNGSIGSLNTGGRYNPGTDSWTNTTIVNAPSGRPGHTAVWTGSEMIVWGGGAIGGAVNTGGRYNQITHGWTATNTTDAPAPRFAHTAVWNESDSEMIVWGGFDGNDRYFDTGGRYCAQAGVPTPTPTPTVTATPTATPSPAPTPTPCTGRCTPTPRPRPTPAPRP